MLLITIGLLFGVAILVWCLVLAVTGADSVSSGRCILSSGIHGVHHIDIQRRDLSLDLESPGAGEAVI